MRAQLKKLTTDTAIYGISSIVGRFLNFLLVPLYTNIIPRADYGVVAAVYSYMAFFNVIFPVGMEIAFMRLISTLERGTKKDTFSAPFWMITCISIFLACIIHLNTRSIAVLLQIQSEWNAIVPLCGWTLAIDAICVIPFASLRMDNKAKVFASIKSMSILLTVLLNIWFIGIQRMPIVSIFIAGLLGSSLCLALLLPTIRKNISFVFPKNILSPLLKIGLPTIPAGLAGIMLQVIDRPIMLYLTDAETVGLYQANYKLGIFMMLIVAMFQYAWQPFYLQMAKEPNAKQLFARVLTYFILLASVFFLVLTFFLEPILKIPILGYHLIGKEYWSGLYIVPIVLLAYIFTGIGVITSAGLVIEKKTTVMPVVMGVSAGTNILANVVLIPSLGIMGGAVATLLSYVVMACMYWYFTKNIYPVPYEYLRIGKLTVAVAVPILMYSLGWNPFHIDMLFWRAMLMFTTPLLLLAFRFFEAHEFHALTQMVKKFSVV